MSAPFALGNYPRAILHIDGDAFFASCEQSRNPALRGKPVITGAERGIAASMSYEAKARGVTRGMRLFEIRKVCPDVFIMPSDYETYSLLSKRFFDIVRRYTPDVEEYGIDECFADMTGWRRPHRMSYERIAQSVGQDLERELGITFSIGLASTKVLAKAGSKWKKPHGLTTIPDKDIHRYLEKLPVGNVWGIGSQSTALLGHLGVRTALDFALKDEPWVRRYFAKPHWEIWNELQGKSVLSLQTTQRKNRFSIQKMKTFTPPSSDPRFVFAQLCKNIESACIKAREHSLETRKFLVLLRDQTYGHATAEVRLERPSNFAHEIINAARPVFDSIFKPEIPYRATMVALLDPEGVKSQMDLFGYSLKTEKIRNIYAGIDKIRKKYGKHTIHFGSSHLAHGFSQHAGDRSDAPMRKRNPVKGETARKRLAIPMFLGDIS